jgi:two-component system response regulator FixJ
MTSGPVVHVIDDDDAARDSLTFLLASANLSVLAYESARAFLDGLTDAQSGCIITDIRMPEISGLDLLRKLKNLNIEWPVIVITGQADVPVAVDAIKAGAIDFIEKPYDAEVLLAAVKFALGGQTEGLRETQRVEIMERIKSLSPEERQVMASLTNGLPNKAVAHDLGTTANTVEMYRASIMTKMQATSLSHLVRMVLLATR